jgi:plastocyanin
MERQMMTKTSKVRRGGARALALGVSVFLSVSLSILGPRAARAAGEAKWLGDDLPLPLPVKTPQDIGFKSATERQYLIFNLMAGGKLAYQRGDYGAAVDKWETLLRMPGLDPQIERAVTPFLDDARAKSGQAGAAGPAGKPGPHAEPPHVEPEPVAAPEVEEKPAAEPHAHAGSAAHHTVTVSGMVSGGGQIGPGGTVVWLRRLDGPTPRTTPAQNQIVTQRDKTFLPHVLAVPVGTTVQFRNDDRIYHNVFSIAKPNEFDAGIRATGATYTKTFSHPGVVELLCNIHSTMNAYVLVVDSPLYAKAQASGAFVVHGVPPGKYELSAWHEAASTITRKPITVGAEGARDLAVSVGGDKRPSPFVPDKYGHKRQPQLGY